jgi:biopolymer transport protein TolR
MGSRWQHENITETAEDELNLVPYLDIMVNLVIFLLFSYQVVIEMCRIDILAPAYGTDGPGPSTPQTTITIAASKSGYTVLSTDTMMGVIEVPRLPSGAFDTDTLHTKMLDWKKNFKLQDGVVLTADSDTPYEVIVQTMDAVRKDGDTTMFPEVMLAQVAGQRVLK